MSTVPIQAALPPSTTAGIPLVYGSQAFTKDTVDAAFSVRLWSNASPTLQEAFKATPTSFRVPRAIILGDWRLLPYGDDGTLLFQQWDPVLQEYVTIFTSEDMKGFLNANSSGILNLGIWRLQAFSGQLEIQVLENGEYVAKHVFAL